ncbi:MAG: glucose-6-phosphate isomerase [Gammaproteobacteria bacterium]|nr:glucose-6-phosphate isomerase [Gammaproteobacteria bacterium]
MMRLKTNNFLSGTWQKLEGLRTKRSHDKPFQSCLASQYIDLSIHHLSLNIDILNVLKELAQERQLFDKLNAFMRLQYAHDFPYFMLLRAYETELLQHQRHDILSSRANMQTLSEKIRSNQWMGLQGKPMTDVVNIGIGGSDLGPRFCVQALAQFKNTHLRFHFLSDADPVARAQLLSQLPLDTTLFLVSSKSFLTEETLDNFAYVKQVLGGFYQQHFLAITAFPERAKSLGFEHVLAFPEGVIGRYSSCSAVNLISSMMLGHDGFLAFLKGAHEMDKHYLNTDIFENIPLMMALIGIWNINFLNIPTQLLLIYDSRLRLLIDYIQQMDMESNGKSIDNVGCQLNYATGPILWGGLGNQAHHSYYQLLAQGQRQVAIDFLSLAENNDSLINRLCQSRQYILQTGVENTEISAEVIKPQVACNHLSLKTFSPESLGALISLYENKVLSQALIWNINPFNQPGVESAKKHQPMANC